MVLHADGIVHGRRIDLESDIGLPDGARVNVQIQTSWSRLDESRRLIASLCGAWRDDPSIEGVFADVARGREASRLRDVDFDAPS